METDMAQSHAMHKWWRKMKAKNPDAVPSPADSFVAGFDAAREIYIKDAEKALLELASCRDTLERYQSGELPDEL